MSNASLVADVVRVAYDGADFYKSVQQAISDPAIRSIFRRMAEVKQSVIGALNYRLEINGEKPPLWGTLTGKWQKGMAHLRAVFSRNEVAVYVSELEKSEDRLLGHLEEAICRVDDLQLRNRLESHLPQVLACHQEMRNLKYLLGAKRPSTEEW